MLIGCAVSALAVYYLLQQVALEDLGQALGRARPLPIVLLVLTIGAALFTRGTRWQAIFLPHRRVPLPPVLRTVSISYLPLPLRAGEVLRVVFLASHEKIPVPSVVGTVLLEKLFDFLALGVMLAILITLTSLPPAAIVAGLTVIAVILVGFGFVVGLAVWRDPTLSLLGFIEQRLPFGIGPRIRLEQAARQFAQGTDSLRHPKLWAVLLGWTAATWLFSVAATWAGLSAVSLSPGLPAMLFVILLTSTGQAVPSSPGYVGVYHFWATFALTTFGVDPTSALAFAVLSHAFSYGPLCVIGLIALWSGGYSLSDLRLGLARRPSAEPLPLAPDA